MRQSAKARVTTIVLTWNSADFIEDCLDSLLASGFKTDILVVDNNSADETRELIAKKYPKVRLVNSGDNLGYAGGNNFGIKHVEKQSSDYLFILNPDAKVDPDCIGRLVRRLDGEKQLAGVSPIIYYNDSRKIWYAGSNIDWQAGSTPHIGWNEVDTGQYAHSQYTERLNGCAMLLRRTAIEETNLMDENYFLYYEETDWSVRFVKADYRLGFEATASVWHQTSSSTGGYSSPTYQYYMTRNRLYFVNKFRPDIASSLLRENVAQSYREVPGLIKQQGLKKALRITRARTRAYFDYRNQKFGRRRVI